MKLLQRDIGGFSADLARVGDEIRLLAVSLGVATLLLGGGAIAVSLNRRRSVVEREWGSGGGRPRAHGLRRPALAGCGPGRGSGGAGRGGRRVGRVPRGPEDGRLGRRGLGRNHRVAAAALIKPVDLGQPLRHAAAWVGTQPRHPALASLVR